MDLSSNRLCTAFAGTQRLATGHLTFVAQAVKSSLENGDKREIVIFDNHTSEVIEVDFRGSQEEVAKQFSPAAGEKESEPAPTKSRGRPKLGVVAKEITLLPRHWDWLNQQPASVSATLRKLVEQASRQNQQAANARQAQDIVYRFINVVASHLNEYEEALRALYAKDGDKFQQLIREWPADVVAHLKKLAPPAFA